ncbi:hypothetical protein HY413_00830 [Candidatus Kaiserbacteria bacterium]|nr:hypothetical protein [Candidatus Kaiserbacteria bacterium]
MPADIIKIIAPAVVAFIVGIGITPIVTFHLYKYRVWKKSPGKVAFDGTSAVEFNRLHAEDEVKTPRMGGIVIWASVVITIIGIALLARWWPTAATLKLDFLSRDQTWIPLMTLLIGALVGFLSDFLDVRGTGKGLSLRYRLSVICALSFLIGWWFYGKLDVSSIGIPFGVPFEIGWLIIPFFVLVAVALYASGVIDGIDGLSGGVFAAVFASYTLIAAAQNQINLAAFSAAVLGGILAFLWFNIPPARFYMTETGTMALTLTIAVLAFMTDTPGEGIGIAVLPVIGFLLVATVASNILQIASKRFFGQKLLRVAPLHHHFEAIGWPGYKVTMRYWVLAVMFAFVGVIIALVGA